MTQTALQPKDQNSTNDILGAGGGGGKKSGAREAKNNLFSDTRATFLFAYSGGPVVPVGTDPSGSVDDPRKSVYFGDTVLMNADGSLNFEDVATDFREGLPSQIPVNLPAIDKVETGIAPNAALDFDNPYVTTISDTQAQAVEVTIGFPQGLVRGNNDGDLLSTAVEIEVDVQENGGGFTLYKGWTVSGKTDASYARSFRIDLTPGTGPWDIRVRRITADSTTAKLRNATTVAQVDAVKYAALSYPHTALMGVSHLASEFGGSTQIGLQTYGRIIKVPNGYDAVARTYPTLWDGTFIYSWTDNPAWVALDILTDKFYGLGLPTSSIDVATFYDIAKYCDEFVADGKGGAGPRYTFNGQIMESLEPIELVNQIAAIWRGRIYPAGSLVTATCDKPSDPVIIVNPTNVIEGRFTWSTSSLNERKSVFKARYIEPSRGYKEAVETVIDPDLQREIGYKEMSIDLPYCTDQAQANRACRWALYTQQYETEIVTWQAGIDHFINGSGAVMPGQIVCLRDPARAGTDGTHGRLKEATATQVTLDREVTFDAAYSYTLEIMGSDGHTHSVPVTLQGTDGGVPDVYAEPDIYAVPDVYATGGASGTGAVLEGDFSFGVEDRAVWLLTWSALEPEKVRVLSVVWEDKAVATVTAVKHNPSKYAAIEQGLALETPRQSLLALGAVQPVTFDTDPISAYMKEVQGIPTRHVQASWIASPDSRVVSYDVYCQFPLASDFEFVGNASVTSLEILARGNGDYAFRVVAVAADGQRSVVAEAAENITSFDDASAILGPDDLGDLALLDEVDTNEIKLGSVSDIVRVEELDPIAINDTTDTTLASVTIPDISADDRLLVIFTATVEEEEHKLTNPFQDPIDVNDPSVFGPWAFRTFIGIAHFALPQDFRDEYLIPITSAQTDETDANAVLPKIPQIAAQSKARILKSIINVGSQPKFEDETPLFAVQSEYGREDFVGYFNSAGDYTTSTAAGLRYLRASGGFLKAKLRGRIVAARILDNLSAGSNLIWVSSKILERGGTLSMPFGDTSSVSERRLTVARWKR